MFGGQSSPAALGQWRRGEVGELVTARVQGGRLYEEVEAFARYVEPDEVAVTDESERPAAGRFPGHVEHDSAVRGTAHPPVRDPDHVADALLGEVLRDGDGVGFGHAGGGRADVAQHEDVLGRELERGVVQSGGEVVEGVEDRGRQAVEQGMVVHPADPLHCETAIPALIGGIVR